MCRFTGRLLDWEIGSRDAATLQIMIDRLRRWNVVVYCSDYWEAYASVIPSGMLLRSKALTDTVERNNSRQRHWFKRFARRSLVVSKSLEIIDLTMGLFAVYHVNGTVDSLLSLIK